MGIHIRDTLKNVTTNSNLKFQEGPCTCCEIESIFIDFTFLNKNFTVGGIYRHPNGNLIHFTSNLDKLLENLPKKRSIIIAGDMNIDLLKYQNENNLNYITTFMSHRFLPYIITPTRITSHSATCIDLIFLRINKDLGNTDVTSGIIFSDLSDHLPCFMSLKSNQNSNVTTRPLIRLFGESQCNKFVELMREQPWHQLYTHHEDWYSVFIEKVKSIFERSFPKTRI